jgi:hypothetical protein
VVFFPHLNIVKRHDKAWVVEQSGADQMENIIEKNIEDKENENTDKNN